MLVLFVREKKNQKCLTPPFSQKVRHHKVDEKNGLQASDLILEGGLHAPHPALFLWDLYFLPNTSVYRFKQRITQPQAVKAHYRGNN